MKNTLSFLVSFLLLFSGLSVAQETSIEEILWAADWSPNGKWIAVGGNHGKLSIYSGQSFELIREFDVPNTITQLKWHPTEPLLAVNSQISAQKPAILNYDTGKFTFLEEVSVVGARGMDWNTTGQLLAVGDNDGFVLIFDREGKLQKKVATEQRAITSMDWHPEEDILITVGARVALVEPEIEKVSYFQEQPLEVLMLSVEWHPSGKFFVTGDYGDNGGLLKVPPLLQFWEREGDIIRKTEGSKVEIRDLEWSENGKILVTASDKVRTWSKNGKLLAEADCDSPQWGIAWSPDEQFLVSSSEKGMITIWDSNLEKVKEIRQSIPATGQEGGSGNQP